MRMCCRQEATSAENAPISKKWLSLIKAAEEGFKLDEV